MTLVRYIAPPHYILKAYGQTIHGGQTAEFSETELRALAKQGVKLASLPAIDLSPTRPSAHGSRRQWARHAEALGLTVTDEMGRDDIIAAVGAVS